jgi:dipeptidyl aminopeptidase/acylaminoacyl peptidase
MFMRKISGVATLLLSAACWWSTASTAAIHEYKFLAISPDGSRVAAVEMSTRPESDKAPRGPIVIRAVKGGQVQGLLDPCSGCAYSSLAWSPDGADLAFLAADVETGLARVELARAGKHGDEAAPVATLTTFKGIAGSLSWSPKGSVLALLATPEAKKLAGALEASAPQVGEIGAEAQEQRIATISRDGGNLRLISPADHYVYEYDWTPDGRGFVVTTAQGDGDNNWWIAELASVDADTGQMRSMAKPEYQITMPRVSPDGKHVWFIGGLMSDYGTVGGDVYEVPIEGGMPLNRTPNFRGSFESLAWKGGRLFGAALVVDRTSIIAFDPSGTTHSLWSASVLASTGDDASGDADPVFTMSADGKTTAMVVEDFGHAPAVLAGPVGAMKTITTDNDSLAATLTAKSVNWVNEGYNVQGWLVGPAQPAAGKRYPLLVRVHGGPSWAIAPYFGSDDDFQTAPREWVSQGYYVFFPNPRGSFGQGEAFTRANVRDLGGGDFRDILTGIDAVAHSAPVDESRMGIFGHSYGGFMTMWAVTHTQRFKTAVAGAGIANWISYYGENGIDRWMIPFFGKSAYGDPAVYRAASPLESINQAHTPTLIYVGERDVECPAPQSFEFWHALRALNVPTQLVVYSGSGHAIHKPDQVRDVRRREADWFAKYLMP